MKFNLPLRQIFGATLSILLFTSFLFVGCGASEDESSQPNNQPTIEPISDITLFPREDKAVDVNIADADVDDAHTISAFSDNTTIATVSVDEASITITGKAEGIATIAVSAIDHSGQDNAEATSVTFKATVNIPTVNLPNVPVNVPNVPRPSVPIGIGLNQPPSAFLDKGACTVGMTLEPGEGCHYHDDDLFIEFFFLVREDGTACRQLVLKVLEGIEILENLRPHETCVEFDIERDDFFDTDFAASKNPDGSWTIDRIP